MKKVRLIIPFIVECCMGGQDAYQSKWEAKFDSELNACHKSRPGALVEVSTQWC